MKAFKIAAIALAIVAVMGCITIQVHVTFPEAQLQAAADKIVENVQSGTVVPAPPTPPQEPPAPTAPGTPTPAPAPTAPSPTSMMPQHNWLASLSLISAVYAEDININIQNAEIEAIQAKMQKNYAVYKPFKDNGSVGENLTGFLEERKEGSASLSKDDKKKLRDIINRENRDRKDLYTAILKANNIDESEMPRLQAIFAKSWYGKSEANWYVQYADPEKGTIWLTKADWDTKPKVEE